MKRLLLTTAALCLVASVSWAAAPSTITGPNGKQAGVDSNGNLQVVPNTSGPVNSGVPAPNSTLLGCLYPGSTLPTITATQQAALPCSLKGGLFFTPLSQNGAVQGQVATPGDAQSNSTAPSLMVWGFLSGYNGVSWDRLQVDGLKNLKVLPAVLPVTPVALTVHVVTTGGTAVTAFAGPVKGCEIYNPPTATDEGITTAETLYVDIVNTATVGAANGTSHPVPPGSSWNCPPGQTTSLSANGATSLHNFVGSTW
jgi:hypothetical protein